MEHINTIDIKTLIAESVIDLFDTMLSMKVEPSETDSETRIDGAQMIGTLSMAGDVVGSIVLQLSDAFARLMTAATMGIDTEEVESDEEIKDVIREVCNIIGGSFKSTLNDLGLSNEISIPSIITGSDFAIETLDMERYEFLAFRYQEHVFFVEICIKAAADIEPEKPGQLTAIDFHEFKDLDLITASGNLLIEFFKTMLDLDVKFSEKVSKPDFENLQIMGLINFTGSVKGSLNIQTNYDFARIMTTKMLGIKLEEIGSDKDVKNVVGKIEISVRKTG